MRIRVRLMQSVVLLAACAAAGCAETAKKPTVKVEARKQWDGARAGVLFSLAKDQYQSGNFDRCRETLNEATRLAPENAQVRVMSARLAIEQAQFDIAERELKLARQFDPGNAEGDFLSGVVYQRWQKPQLAYEFYSQACEKAPTELSYVMAKAEMLVAMDKHQEAIDLLMSKVVYFEHSAAIRDAVGLLMQQERKYPEAVAMIRQATILTPDDLTVREHLAMALYYDHEYAECVVVLVRLMKDDHYAKRPDLLTTLGEAQFALGRFRDARESFESASIADSGTAGIWLGIGKSAMQLGDMRRAELSYKKALAIDPVSPETNLMVGYLRLRQGRLDEALSAFIKVNAADGKDTLGLCMMGYALEKLGRGAEAVKCYAEALKINPRDELASKLMASVQD